MNHADAFVADVVANPHDDAPRLIYADWLLDQDEPATRARAELIRVQYALEEIPPGDVRRAALAQRERDVLLAYEKEWTAGLRERGVRSWRFRRGFVEGVKLFPESLFEQGEQICSLIPLRELELTVYSNYPWETGSRWSDWDLLAELPLFAQLDGLDVTEINASDEALRGLLAEDRLPQLSRLRVTREAAVALASGSGVPGLRALRIQSPPQGHGYAAPSISHVFSSACLAGLTRLEITSRGEDLCALSQSPLAGRLEELSLRGLINESVGRRFGSAPFPRLRRADLAEVGPGVRTLLPGYARLPELLTGVESLDLSVNALRDSSLLTLAEGAFENLRHLVLSRNPIGRDGAAVIARSASLASLESLHLRAASLGDAGLAALAAMPRLRELNVSYNRITAAGLRELSERWPAGLTVLDLSWNPCRDGGIIALCASADLASLKALDLSYCELGDGAVQALAASARLTNLQTLNLSTNRITDVGLIALAESHLSGLHSLHLGNTSVTDKGVEALFDSPLLSRLEVLMLNGTEVSESMRTRLRKVFRGILG